MRRHEVVLVCDRQRSASYGQADYLAELRRAARMRGECLGSDGGVTLPVIDRFVPSGAKDEQAAFDANAPSAIDAIGFERQGYALRIAVPDEICVWHDVRIRDERVSLGVVVCVVGSALALRRNVAKGDVIGVPVDTRRFSFP